MMEAEEATSRLEAIGDLLVARAAAVMDRRADPDTGRAIRAHVAALLAAEWAIVEPLCGPLTLAPRAQTRYGAPRWLAEIPDRGASPPEPPPAPAAPPPPRIVQVPLPFDGAPR